MSCPGCGGPKSKRAQLCASCRREANAVGASVVTHVAGARAPRPVPELPRTSGQNRAYHGKCGTLARLWDRPVFTVKTWALSEASEMFGRPIESSRDLSEDEMSDVLDRLDQTIAEAEAST